MSEVRAMTDRLISESALRVRTRLRAAWAQRVMQTK
jgi:hypothetical protein